MEYKKKSETNWVQWGNEYSSSNTLETTITGLTEGTTYQARVQAKNSQGNSSWSDPGEGKTQEKNVDPEFSADTATRSIAENSAADANVGAAVTTTDTESDTLTYSLSGTDASSFTIDSATGQIKVGSEHDAGLRIIDDVLLRNRGRQRPQGQQRHGGHGG